MSKHQVYVYVYDLSNGLAKQMSPLFLGKTIEGVWHTAVVVYNREYFFGGLGISHCFPGQSMAGNPLQKLFHNWANSKNGIITLNKSMGETTKSEKEFEAHLTNVRPNYTSSKYDLLQHNCNNFTDEMCLFLVNKRIPAHITGLPAEVMSSPMGAVLRPILSSLQNNNSLNSGNIPFGGSNF
ncbi:hypothetical protein MHBO_004366, partial [Bonamia ostreae]